ncbi:TetR/AcrR family transcriptional regulator [Furfurilactobacillus entadae]|uniref:TetR/AcrR family transcriptional regulator n=1 Tax=Furfurilactobacillus entadae TaxID=2922307 RepID=UPI0035E7D31D
MLTKREAAKQRALLERVMTVVARDGFQQLTMNQLITIMGVSRRTAYKYFSSKEAVIKAVVDVYQTYINDFDLPKLDGDDANFFRQFQLLFDQSLTIARTVSPVFLADLHQADEALARNLQDVLAAQQQQAVFYYQTGVTRGLFRDYNWDVLLLQDQTMIRALLDQQFLLRHDITLTGALMTYYEMKKVQLLQPEQLAVIDDQPVRLIIEYFVNEYQRTFL